MSIKIKKWCDVRAFNRMFFFALSFFVTKTYTIFLLFELHWYAISQRTFPVYFYKHFASLIGWLFNFNFYLISSDVSCEAEIFFLIITNCSLLYLHFFQDDYYLNLVDWSSTNYLSVALGNSVYLWSASNLKVWELWTSNTLSSLLQRWWYHLHYGVMSLYL